MDTQKITMVKFQNKTYTNDVLYELKCAILNSKQTKDLLPAKKARADFISNIEIAQSIKTLYNCVCDCFSNEAFGIEKIELIIDPNQFTEIDEEWFEKIDEKIKHLSD